MKAPFPYFGGKSAVAPIVWAALGDVPNYVEPFFGSGAVLLARPASHKWAERIETANDADGLIANFWRATQAAPDEVAKWADWPVNENDLTARHAWLVGQKDSLQAKLEGDPDYYDAKVAGWWVWGISSWIGSGWCSGKGPWRVVDRKLVHLSGGRGINRKRVQLRNGGEGINATDWRENLEDMMGALRDRLRRVRVCCGDWSRVCGFSPTTALALTGVFLDPPYSQEERAPELYGVEMEIATSVRDWAVKRGADPLMRIVLCGYEGEHAMPEGWTAHAWKANGGYGSQGEGRGRENASREVLWFSPHCLKPSQQAIMPMMAGDAT